MLPTPAHASGITIIVNTAADTLGDGHCSFQEAMAAATTNTSQDSGACPAGSNLGAANPDVIQFNISGSGVQIITLTAPIDITDVVTIDGTTQPGYNGSPLVRVDGSNVADLSGLVFSSGSAGSTLRGLMVTRFGKEGVVVQTGDSNNHVTLLANYIGTDGNAAAVLDNQIGVAIYDASYTQIGGPSFVDRNVISRNIANVLVDSTLSASDHTVIRDNYIGVNAGGQGKVGGGYGIYLTNDGGSVVGTQITGNLLSGNGYGIYISDAGVDDTLIASNTIGTNASGSVAIPNSEGVMLVAASNTTISGNQISGNGRGIDVAYPGVTDTTIAGNLIGTNAAGTAAVGNFIAINIADGVNTTIGGTTPGSGNVISGNTSVGIRFNGGNPANTRVFGNKIGTDKNGMSALPNALYGIWQFDAPADIGDATTPGNNLISGNGTVGIYISSPGTSGTTVFGNKLGLNADGTATLGNGDGIDLSFGASAQIASNWIGNSAGYGVGILDAPSSVVSGSSNNCITGNAVLGVYDANINPGTAPFTDNWWGSKTGPTYSGNPSGTGDAISDHVSYSPFLTTAPPACTILQNASFETDANHDKKPDNWSFTNFNSASDKRDCTVHKSDLCSLKLRGNGKKKTASQTVMKSGIAGDQFSFSLWSRANSIPTGSVYRLQVRFYNGSTLLSTKSMNFTNGTHKFKMVSGTFTTPGPYDKIIFSITFKAPSGTAWFDTAGLSWAP